MSSESEARDARVAEAAASLYRLISKHEHAYSLHYKEQAARLLMSEFEAVLVAAHVDASPTAPVRSGNELRFDYQFQNLTAIKSFRMTFYLDDGLCVAAIDGRQLSGDSALTFNDSTGLWVQALANSKANSPVEAIVADVLAKRFRF